MDSKITRTLSELGTPFGSVRYFCFTQTQTQTVETCGCTGRSRSHQRDDVPVLRRTKRG